MSETLHRALQWKAEQIPEECRCHGCGGQGYFPSCYILGDFIPGKVCPVCEGEGTKKQGPLPGPPSSEES